MCEFSRFAKSAGVASNSPPAKAVISDRFQVACTVPRVADLNFAPTKLVSRAVQTETVRLHTRIYQTELACDP
jgi:hypothetical protein